MKRVGRAVEFLAWTTFFAVAALVLALRFWLLPNVELYRDPIVAAVSRTVGQPVRIAGIQAGWFGLEPRIRLRDVRIYDREGREALVLPSVDNVLSWSSLVRGRLKLRSLAIEGLRVQVRRDAAGALYIAGSKLSGDSQLTDWTLAQDEIVLRDAEIEWHDERRGAPPLALSGLNLRLRNSGDSHSIGMVAHPPTALGSTLELRALLEGNTVTDPSAWKGRVYAELGYTDLAAWRAWIDYPWEIERGQGAVRAWLTLDAGEIKRATADVSVSDVVARLRRDLAPLRLSSLQGRLQGRVESGRYELRGRGLAAAVEGGASIPPSDFHLSWGSGRDAAGTLAASAIELEPLIHLTTSLPIPRDAEKLLARMRPRGRLTEARFDWRGDIQAPTGFNLRSRFSALSSEATGALPGFAGIAGSIDTTEAKGKIQLASRSSALFLPQVFPQPRLALDFLNGQVEWERQGEVGFMVRAASLSFSNERFSGNAHGTYSRAASGPGSIDLSAQLSRADASDIGTYLPHARLMGGEAMRDWLARSVLAGRSGDVRVRIAGDLRDFPFSDPRRGQFSVSARIDKGVLNYVDGWPRVENIEGDLLFDRDRMRVVGRSGRIRGVALTNVEVAMALLDPNAQVAITGEAEGANAEFLEFIHASPVRGMIAGATDTMSASGRGKLRLKLDLPLKELANTRVAGDYEFTSNNFAMHPQLPPIERASGRLSFTGSTLTVNDLHGRLFGGAVAISGSTRPGGGMQILAKGEATVAATRALFEHPWQRYLSGAANYAATVELVNGRTRVLVESPLQGIASALPAPFAKSASEALPLRLELSPDDRISVKLGRVVAAEVVRRRQGDAIVVQRSGVSLSPTVDAPIRLPERGGTLVYGSLAAIDLDKWLPLFTATDGAPGALTFDVHVGALDLYGRRMNDVSARAGVDGAGWSGSVSAQELAGDLSFRKDRLVARLTRLQMPDEYDGAPSRNPPPPKELPSMDLVAERFTWRGKQLGRIELTGQPVAEEWRIQKLNLTSSEATLAASGAWRSGNPTRSSLDFELNTTDAGQFLARVGYPDLVKAGKAQLKGSLTWNGHPGLIDYPSLSGEMQLQAHNGQFLEIEPGLGKLVSLMSLQSLPRRISLDFRDVFSKGFEFERIFSSGHVEGGVMMLKDFRMRGSGAQVEMSGEVDLARETQNLRVRVVPSLGDSAATVIALVNPLLAIPAAIAQKILKDPLGHIFAFDYSVSGGWADPKVAKLGMEARASDPQQGIQ